MTAMTQTFTDKQALAIRLSVGLVFGLVIATLNDMTWTWSERLATGLALLAPVVWAGVGTMRRSSLIIWTLIAAILIGAILWFEKTTSISTRFNFDSHYYLLLPLLFIAHELVSSGDIARKWIAPFETYFEEAWKRGVQLALAILFTLLFWGILQLGAALLGFIGFDWFKKLLEHEHFSLPITGLAFGAAVHLGDVQTKLLSNVRALVLGVLSWLLPVITLIGAIFAGSLVVSGLAPLWATKAATATLLGGCVGFVLLINAAYQQGDQERHVSAALTWSARVAALLLLAFAVLAAWSLSLRIGQYGLSPDRVLAGLGVVIALAYGLGYSASLVIPGRWMAGIERVNIYLAIFKCALFVAILTPIAAPDRLSVNDQVARLNAGKVGVDKFDWWLLKDETGTYGKTALARLAGSQNAAIAAKAKLALEDKIGEQPFRYSDDSSNRRPATRADVEALQVVFPAGAKLPDSFLATNFQNADEEGSSWDECLRFAIIDPAKDTAPANCKVALLDLTRDGKPEVLLRNDAQITVFTQTNGTWQRRASIFANAHQDGFDGGKLSAVTSQWDDIKIGDQVLSVRGFDSDNGAILPNKDAAPVTPTPPKASPPPSK
jgi:hypothetical protein